MWFALDGKDGFVQGNPDIRMKMAPQKNWGTRTEDTQEWFYTLSSGALVLHLFTALLEHAAGAPPSWGLVLLLVPEPSLWPCPDHAASAQCSPLSSCPLPSPATPPLPCLSHNLPIFLQPLLAVAADCRLNEAWFCSRFLPVKGKFFLATNVYICEITLVWIGTLNQIELNWILEVAPLVAEFFLFQDQVPFGTPTSSFRSCRVCTHYLLRPTGSISIPSD